MPGMRTVPAVRNEMRDSGFGYSTAISFIKSVASLPDETAGTSEYERVAPKLRNEMDHSVVA